MKSIFEMDDKAGEYSDELFAKGYILSERLPSCPSGWLEGRFGSFLIAHHPDLSLTYARCGQTEIACLGLIFDSRSPRTDQQDVLSGIAEALARSEADMFELLSHTNGRYVLIYPGDDGRPYLLHDATGMRSVMFHVGEQVTVSSHLRLLEIDVARFGERDARDFKFGFPGRLTPNRAVRALTPNTRLCLSTGNVARFWPTQAVEKMSLSEAAHKVGTLLRNSFEWIDQRHDHFATVTAGLDSRVTLAVIGNETRYATYYRNDQVDTDLIDKETTELIARKLGLNHRVLGPETREHIPEAFRQVVRFNTFKSHIPGMAWAYRECMVKSPSETIHIRSNLSEIGRMFYQGRGSSPKTGADLNTLWSTRAGLRNDENAAAFQEFADTTQFFATPVEHSSLFYWEHRMGTWHSQVPLESDVACETLSLYNCRSLLALMWAVSEHAQKKSLLLKRIVATRSPELTQFELNGGSFRPSDNRDSQDVFADTPNAVLRVV